ncbi:CPBP family intramembrane glutamic endopeptidase, partial [Janibacter limosus]|uniref:CPBP family intramembrane glutamic endopeptidase n=1 Tax=Janibacter limosus TaxID=53458 RepID=UPI0008310EC3
DAGGARPAADFLSAPGTTWTTQDPTGAGGATTIRSGGSPFAVLSVLPLAAEAGIHPVAVGLVEAARRHAQARHAPAGVMTTAGTTTFAPFADDVPRSYLHQMRTTHYRWWRPLLALAAGLGTFLAISIVLSILWLVLDPSMLETTDAAEVDPVAPVTMLIGNLMLAGLIPAALVATRVGHWRPMGKIWSVAGRIRWRWLGRATLVTTVLWGAYLAAAWVLSGEQPSARPDHWGWLLLITVLTTPLQAAGEEVAFRGGLMQGVGAWIKRPVLALVVSTVLSAATFALAHTSLDPWVLFDLAGMAAACCYLTWRTGGLEAAIVLHVVNNMVIVIGLTVLGGIQDAYVTEQTTSTADTAGLSVVATAIMTAILLWLARRSGIAPKKFGAPATNEIASSPTHP